MGEIILPGDERYDLGEKFVAEGEEGGQNNVTLAWSVINGEKRPK